jgi:hypothetical protein
LADLVLVLVFVPYLLALVLVMHDAPGAQPYTHSTRAHAQKKYVLLFTCKQRERRAFVNNHGDFVKQA